MRRRQSARIVFVLMFISTVLLILSFAGVLNPPIKGANHFGAAGSESGSMEDPDQADNINSTNNNETQPTMQEEGSLSADPELTDETESNSADPTTADGITDTEREIRPLPLAVNDPDLLEPAEGDSLRLWPSESAVPLLYEADLDQYHSPENQNRPLKGITVILDPSYGGSTTGASVTTDSGIYLEKDIVLSIARFAERYLSEMGAEVIMTRSSDVEHSLFYVSALTADTVLQRYATEAEKSFYERQLIDDLRLQMADVMRINQNSPASGGRGLFGSISTPARLRLIYDIQAQFTDHIFINIALNFDSDTELSGTEIRIMSQDFVTEVNNSYIEADDTNSLPPNYNMIDSQARSELAWLLYGHIGHQLPDLAADSEPRISEKDMAVLRLNNLVSASVVPGYLSNEADFVELTSLTGQQKIGSAIAYAIRQYFLGP